VVVGSTATYGRYGVEIALLGVTREGVTMGGVFMICGGATVPPWKNGEEVIGPEEYCGNIAASAGIKGPALCAPGGAGVGAEGMSVGVPGLMMAG